MFTALVVDDDAAFRLALGEILLLEGYRTLSASTCREALVHLEAGAADLLFVDLNLPDGSGLDLLPRAELPAVVVTGETSLLLADATLRLGARDCLTKPVDRLRVRMTLAHIARERRLQEDVARLSHEVGSLRAGTLLR